nr:MAG TPA: hypothetical protein [Bacteriophage sp.]
MSPCNIIGVPFFVDLFAFGQKSITAVGVTGSSIFLVACAPVEDVASFPV